MTNLDQEWYTTITLSKQEFNMNNCYINPRTAWDNKEAKRIKEKLENGSYIKNKVIYWSSVDRVVPNNIAEYAQYLGYDADLEKCSARRSEELQEFISAYRKSYSGPSEEERAEARAAFGRGKKLVNVLTGDTWYT